MSDKIDQPTNEREAALLRLKKKRDLRGHLFAFAVVNGAFWILWAFTGAAYPWPAWITGLWGIGIVFNVWDVYFRRPITEADVQREIARSHPSH